MQEGLPDPNHREPLDARLSLWFAAQVILDAPARLIEAGAGAEARIELASVYVDLAAEGCGEEEIGVTRRLCRATDPVEHRPLGRRYLLVGGPGSGKSTATTMAAQLLRAPWVRAGAEHLPAAVREAFEKAAAGLDALSAQVLEGPSRVAIPLRVSLPALARSIANGSGSSRGAVWRFLAGRMADDVAAVGATVAMDADTLREMASRSAPIFWIFDGLDEVPRSAGREAVVGAIREVLAEVASGVDGLVVSTRPQGYEGEFDALDPLVLRPLEEEEATEHGERLLRAWLGAGATLTERVEDWRRALARDDIRSLVTSPLHTAMAALLVAAEGTLPASRAMLFQLYFEELFKRELTKPAGDRLQRTEREVVQALHARVGLILHVRAQEGSGAHAELSRRELREVLTSLYRGYRSAAPRDAGEEEVVRGAVERMMRFTTERLVLLLHGSEGGYSFGVRSLQEYFAAAALAEGPTEGTRRALERVALDPHWENVLALLVSDCALWPLRRREGALAYTVGLCRALAEGTVGGEAAVRCCAGSRLALVMLRETERYGHAWLHEPLWELAFRASEESVKREAGSLRQRQPDRALRRDRERFREVLLVALREPAEPAFLTAAAWRDHGFPEPFLGTQAPDRYAITAIPELANLRLFRDTPTLDAPLPRPPSGEGQWIVLVGENGSGKTTLLRALALALASPAVASKLLDEKLPFVRNGGDGRIAVQLDGATFRVAVRRDERARTETVVPLVDEPPHRPWVVGYGVRRGNARGEDDRPPAFGPMGDLHSLFDRPAALVHAVDWLKELHRNVLLEGSAPRGRGVADGLPGERAAIWRAVVRAMTQLLGVTVVEPGFEHVTVKHPKFGDVRFDALSDGYLTTAGWVLDMIARWIDRQRDLDERVGPDPLRRMAGFALVDELDLHLHPVWQMNIVDDLRRLFPRMSFVVTTHNPLTLQGARPGETFIMRREGNDITLVQRDVQPGHDVDRVLFEQFNLRDTFDRETRAMLRDHRAMLEAGASADDPGRLALERQLEERLGAVGSLVRGQRRGKGDPMPRLRDDEQGLLDALLDKE